MIKSQAAFSNTNTINHLMRITLASTPVDPLFIPLDIIFTYIILASLTNQGDIMKVRINSGIGAYSGRKRDIVYCYHRASGLCYAREYSSPALSKSNGAFSAIQQNLKSLKPSEAYIQDWKKYIQAHNGKYGTRDKQFRNWYCAYKKMLFDLQKAYPQTVNLATLTREQIYAEALPCISLKAAVEAQLIPQVKGWQSLTQQI